MKPNISKLHITQFTAEFSSKYLIIIYMNNIPVLNFETKGGVTLPDYPDILSTGAITAAYEGKVLTMTWTLNYANNPYGLELQMLIFDTDKPAAAIIGTNGKPLKSGKGKIHTFPVNLNSGDRLAEDIATYFIQRLKGEADEES